MAENETVDDLIRFYADEAERIYAHRTRGDFTWVGLLASFLMAVDDRERVLEAEAVATPRIAVTQTKVNQLAQLFYEASALRQIPMTAKPQVVNGLRAVLRDLSIEVVS